MLHRAFSLLLLLLASSAAAAHLGYAEPDCAEEALAETEGIALVPLRPPDSSGVVVTAPLTTAQLVYSYTRGAFPWDWDPARGKAIYFSPKERGIMHFADYHVPDRFRRSFLRDHGAEYFVTFDESFPAVIEACAQQIRVDQPETWILQDFRTAYKKLFTEGLAHSIEVRDARTRELVGGIYGTYIRGVFAGESMFTRRPNVTKLAFMALHDRLKRNGHSWFDTQTVTSLPAQFGAKLIPRDEFEKLLAETQKRNLPF